MPTKIDTLPTGKLPATLLASLLSSYTSKDSDVILGPSPGEDAAVIDLGGQYLVATTDPITFATQDIGWYAVNVNANDIACCGAEPRWFMATILLPENASAALAEQIFAQIHDAADALSVSVVGGHTEITVGLERPIVVGQMMGLVAPEKLIRTGGARVGDDLVLTKAVALEGTALLVAELRDELANVLTEHELNTCSKLLREPGISVVRDAEIACAAGGIHAMHDPTEGGLATGLAELAHASGVGVRVRRSSIPIVAHCERICERLSLDPLGLIASGALLLSVAPECTDALTERLIAQGISASVIGSVTDANCGCVLQADDGTSSALSTFERDEITKVFK